MRFAESAEPSTHSPNCRPVDLPALGGWIFEPAPWLDLDLEPQHQAEPLRPSTPDAMRAARLIRRTGAQIGEVEIFVKGVVGHSGPAALVLDVWHRAYRAGI